MIYLYFMSLFLLTMYIMYAVRVCGVPWSLSDTYYQLKKRNRPAWLFQIAMIVPAMLLMPVWIAHRRTCNVWHFLLAVG